MASQPESTPVRRSPLPSAGELDAEIERKLQQYDASRKRDAEPDRPAAGNGGER